MEQIHSRDPTSPKTSKNSPPPRNFMNRNKPVTRLCPESHEFSLHPHTLCLLFHLSLLSLQRLNVSRKFLVQLFQPNCQLVHFASSRQTSHLIFLYLTTVVLFLGSYNCSTGHIIFTAACNQRIIILSRTPRWYLT
jgi:hypothetical protein